MIWSTQATATNMTDVAVSGLSEWSLSHLFFEADLVVQSVMICLLLASVAVWTITLVKFLEIRAAQRRAQRALLALSGCGTLDDADILRQLALGVESQFVEAAQSERRATGSGSTAGVHERTQTRLGRIGLAEYRRLSSGLGILASVGSNSPFVGLFGTVWGIMNSFIGISQAQTTSLTVVAPGIAEALLATAMGLLAAIPAVVFYNILVRSLGSYRAVMGDVSAEILLLVSRDVDRHNVERHDTDRTDIDRDSKLSRMSDFTSDPVRTVAGTRSVTR